MNRESLDKLARDAGIELGSSESAGFVMRKIASAGLNAANGLGPELVQHRPKNLRTLELIEAMTGSILGEVPDPMRLSIASGLLLIHDFWDASHDAAQEAEDRGERRFAPYWHGIAHRREPDAGNASYWFRRVGIHPIFAELKRDADLLLTDRVDDPAIAKIHRDAVWNPYAFIELCTQPRDPEVVKIARRVQILEMNILLEATLAAAGI